jgi:hypothetical protein
MGLVSQRSWFLILPPANFSNTASFAAILGTKPPGIHRTPRSLGHLCQGIGAGPTLSVQQVSGTNTFFLIDYHDILLHKRKEVCHTMVVCEVHPDKDDPDRTRIRGGTHKIVKNILLTFFIFELGDPKIYMSIR